MADFHDKVLRKENVSDHGEHVDEYNSEHWKQPNHVHETHDTNGKKTQHSQPEKLRMKNDTSIK